MLQSEPLTRPAAIVDAATVDDVRAAVDRARRDGLRVAVQATGHGASALGDLETTLVVRTAALTGLAVDPPARSARVAAGHAWRDVHAAVDPLGLAAVATAHPGVGVPGSVLTGGVGWLARAHGLAAESVGAVELVVADGRVVRADPDRERDLFWALRGGGGGLGVITAVELRLLDVRALYAGTLTWPGERAGEVLTAWAACLADAPDELTSIARLRRTAPGAAAVIVEGAFLGSEPAGAALLEPLRALRPAADTFALVTPATIGALHDEPAPAVLRRCEHLLLDELPADAVAALVEAAGAGAGFPLDDVELRHLGGALCRRPGPGSGALATLDAEIAVTVLAAPDAERAQDDALDALAPWAAGHVHGGFAARRVGAGRVFTPDTVRRLDAVKALQDPDGLFVGPYDA